MGKDLKTLPRPHRGFLMMRPFTATGAPRGDGGKLARRDSAVADPNVCKPMFVRSLPITTRGDHRRVIFHVDHILFAGTPESLRIDESVLRTSLGGDAGEIAIQTPIAFAGILIGKTSTGEFAFPRPKYPQEPSEMDPGAFADIGRILRQAKFRTSLL